MKNDFDNAILNMAQTTPEPEDYTGEDGLFTAGSAASRKKPISRKKLLHG